MRKVLALLGALTLGAIVYAQQQANVPYNGNVTITIPAGCKLTGTVVTCGTTPPPPPPCNPPNTMVNGVCTPPGPPPNTECDTNVTCVPIQPGQSLQSALQATAGSGKWTELTKGTYASRQVNFPAHSRLFCDSGAVITDMSGYGDGEDLLALHSSDIVISGSCLVQMPNTYAAAKSNHRQNQSAVDIRGTVSNITLSPGLKIQQSGNDGVFARGASNVLIDGIWVNDPIRNAVSFTGQLTNVTLKNSTLGGARNFSGSGIANEIDLEGNSYKDWFTNINILNNVLQNSDGRAIYLTLWFLTEYGGRLTTPVTVNISGNQSNNNCLFSPRSKVCGNSAYDWSDGKSGSVPHKFTGSGNTENGKSVSFPAGL